MNSYNICIDPNDVLVHPSNWVEIDASMAHLRAAHVPVVAVYTDHSVQKAVLVGTGFSASCSILDVPETRFYLQVGINDTTAAQSAVPMRSMGLSKAGADFIMAFENPKLTGLNSKTGLYTPVDDGYGNMTIGYGHKVSQTENFDKGLTAAQVEQLYLADKAKPVLSVSNALTVGVSQNQFDALVSLQFNLGPNAKNLKPIVVLNQGGAVQASDFTGYCHAGNTVSPGLLTRRKAEWKIFSQNIYDSTH